MIPKFITERFKNLSLQDATKWLKGLFEFFYSPLKLLKDFSTGNKKFEQLLFYSVLLVIILAINYKEYEISDIRSYQVLISLLLYTLPFTIINFLSIRIFRKIDFWVLFANVFLLSLITCIFSFIVSNLYIKNENYNFLLIHTVINVLLIFYSIIIVPIFFVQKKSKKFFAILFNIIGINILTIASIFLYQNDNNSNILSFDPISNEHQKSIENITSFQGKPYSITRIMDSNKEVEYYSRFSFIHNDTIYRNEDKMLEYYKKLFSENSIKINNSIDDLYFKRNKEALNFLGNYFNNLETMFDYNYNKKYLISEKVYFKRDSSVAFYEQEYRINENITKPYKDFMDESKEIYDGYNYANQPTYVISILMIPTSLFLKLIGYEDDSNIMIQL